MKEKVKEKTSVPGSTTSINRKDLKTCGYHSDGLVAANIIGVARTFGKNSIEGPDGKFSVLNLAVDSLKEMKPTDSCQAMLSTQAIAAHNLALEFMARAISNTEQASLELHIASAEKLMNVFLKHIALINKLQGKCQQKVVVEHVHVYAGGQAVVGQVSTVGGGGQKSNL